MDSIIELANSLWVVWLMLVFGGIVAWILWPSRRKTFEEDYSRIPLRDDEPVPSEGTTGRSEEER